ncbi:DUF4145 domain-containing protein [Azospirillum argentinense]
MDDLPDPVKDIAEVVGGSTGSHRWELITAIFGWGAVFFLLAGRGKTNQERSPIVTIWDRFKLGFTHKGNRGEPLPVTSDAPPDSEKSSGTCPRCGTHSSFEYLNSLPLTFDGGRLHHRDGTSTPTYSDRATVMICRHCHQGVLVLEEAWVGDNPAREQPKGGGVITWRGFHWWPNPGAVLHDAVPVHIRTAFNEAVQAVSANCPRAGVVMARRTLEAITADKGEDKGPLHQRLRALADKNLLVPTLADWAKEVRIIGNAGAHYDPMDEVSIEDARQLLGFMKDLMNYLYVMPAELTQRRHRTP